MKKILFASLLITVSGCASFTSPAREHDIDLKSNKAIWFDYNAERRGALLFSPDIETSTSTKDANGDPINTTQKAKFKYCAEPAPDIAFETTQKLLADVKAKTATATPAVEGEGKIDESFNQNVVQLASKSQTILFIRESLYRLCELSINNAIDESDVVNLYDNVLQAALKYAEAELTSKQAALAQSQADKAKQETKKVEEERKNLMIKKNILDSFGKSPDALPQLNEFLK